MKKRLLCLIMILVMVLPLILSSCGDEMTAEELANENFRAAEKALTLSVWLPVPRVDLDGDGTVDGVDPNFQTRMDAVEAEINSFLRSGNYCTLLEIVAIDEAEYYEKLTAEFASIKEAEAKDGKAYLTADKYVNHAVANKETGIYEMAYPEVLDTQLDIFFVGGYDNYLSFVDSGDTYALNDFFTEGKVYNGLFKKIRSVFMDAMKVDGKYHAIPNNHVYAEGGQCILVNKELFNAYSNMTWEEGMDLYSLQAFIESVGSMSLDNVVPFVGTGSDIPGVVYLDKDNLVASSVSTGYVDSKTGLMVYEPKYLYDLDEYKAYTQFYKDLCANNYAFETLADGMTAAVKVVDGNSLSLAEYADEYYIIESVPAYANLETMYSSMFAISSHSANYTRAMDILYLLQDNVELRTLLQYGIKGVDYEVVGEGENKTVSKLDSAYSMNILYTGNGYRTYPDYDVPMSYWDSVKDFNLSVQLHPYFTYEALLARGDMTEEDAANLAKYLASVASASATIKETLDKVTVEDFPYFFDAMSYNKTVIDRQLGNAQTAYDDSVAAYNTALENYNNAAEEEKEALAQELENCQKAVEEKQSTLTRWQGISRCYVTYFEGTAFFSAFDMKDRSNLLKLYKNIYTSSY